MKKPDVNARIREMQDLFEDQGFGNAELLEEWDGEKLEDLAALLTEEEYRRLLEVLEDTPTPNMR